MAETTWPSVAGSRSVTDDQYELLTPLWSADGIQGPSTNPSPVFGDASGRQVKIRSGQVAVLNGHGYSSGSSDTIKSVAANGSGSTRIDLVVLGLDRVTWEVTCYVKAGTPGSGVPPTLQRDARGGGSGKWEIPLAQVQVVNGASSISAGDVTNLAWYAHGDTVTTTSTNPRQPPVADYIKMRHSDTGYEYDSVSGVWRRGLWIASRGIIGGQRYTAGTGSIIANAFGMSEAATAQSSGSVQLRANRRYRIQAFMRLYQSHGGATVMFRIRETNVSGTIRAEKQVTSSNQANILDYDMTGEYATGGSDETKTFVVTGFSSTGTWSLYSGTATANFVGVFVEDVGPASPNVITTV